MLRTVPSSRWNYGAAAHLLNRAGFGGTPAEIEQLAALGVEKAVASLVDYEKVPEEITSPDWARPDPDRDKKLREMRLASAQEKQEARRQEQRQERARLIELRAWWLERMVSSKRPLQEKLTLFWHGHFATSAQKVRSAFLMWRQNDIFRRLGSGNWLALLTEVSKDPAMLIWLDQARSRKEHPNENFAREVMELFALGEGNYTEKDITEAARALTGWSYDRQNEEFSYRRNWHDNGEKTVLGRTGNFDGDDVLKVIAEQPQSARFIARKLWVFFAGGRPSDELVGALARQFEANGRNFKPLLRAMFSSEEFYAPDVVRQQVKSPVQWFVSNVRMLERDLPGGQMAQGALRMLGQDLFMPPNVKGWDGGLSWITTNNLLNRYNYAAAMVLGNASQDMSRARKGRARAERRTALKSPVKVERLFPKDVRSDRDKLAAAVQKRFLQAELKPHNQSILRAYLESQGEIDDVDVLHAIRLVMCTPEFQLT